jgi:hypothetical protein
MAEQTVAKRQTAYHCTCQDILQGTIVKGEGWTPSVLVVEDTARSRVRLSGVVVEHAPGSIILDDGSGHVALRSFEQPLPAVVIGDPVLVIGRPRSFSEQPYVLVEILRKLPSHSWLRYFATEREALRPYLPSAAAVLAERSPAIVTPPALQEIVAPAPVTLLDEPSRKGKSQLLLDLIKSLDAGDGAMVSDVLAKAGFPEAEERLQTLIAEGEIFELRAGKVKVLE